MNFRFILQYILHPRATGALLPSSKYLAYKMINNIDFDSCNCIIEFGPGTGVFTEELIICKKVETKLLLIESNTEFYNLLKSKYGHIKNMYIINDSAEKIGYYIDRYNIESVDYIVSGLPFTSLPKDMAEKILNNTKEILKDTGIFITFQYTMLKKSFISNFFKNIKVRKEFINFPPAYVLSCTNKE